MRHGIWMPLLGGGQCAHFVEVQKLAFGNFGMPRYDQRSHQRNSHDCWHQIRRGFKDLNLHHILFKSLDTFFHTKGIEVIVKFEHYQMVGLGVFRC